MSTKSKAAPLPDEVVGTKAIEIKAPNLMTLHLDARGEQYCQNRFTAKAIAQIISTQEAGSKAKGKKVRKPKDFDAVYRAAMHVSHEGWLGIPATAFRNGMISATRTVGYKMTHAKLAVHVLADGYDAEDGTPLVRIEGEPRKHTAYARNANGSVDIRVRPMWDTWSATIRIRYDADMFTSTDIVNLMMRVGAQVGIGEGRPDSRKSAGLGWGLFSIESEEKARAAS